METQLKLRILEVKDLTHFIVREEDTRDALRYKKLEKLLQKAYNTRDDNKGKNFKVGSYVAVYIKPFTETSPQLWLRAIIMKIIEKGLKYTIFLADFGIEKCSHKSLLRELKPHFSPNFVPFQAFNFLLSGIEPKKEVETHEVIKYIKFLFDLNKSLVFAKIQRKDKSGSVLGHILLERDCDLASILINKQLANEKFNNYGISRKNSIRISKNEVKYNANDSVPSFINSFHALNSTTEDCDHSLSPNCKCYGIIQYKRKMLRKLLIEYESVETILRETLSSVNSEENECNFGIEAKQENESENRVKCRVHNPYRLETTRCPLNKTF